MGAFSSGLVGNNIACARSDVEINRRNFSLPDAFVDGDDLLSPHKWVDYDARFDVYTKAGITKDEMKILFENWVNKIEPDDRPRIVTFQKQIKEIVEEASELNDCDKDMDKIRELKRKYIDTFNKVFEYFVKKCYAKKEKQDNYEKKVSIITLFCAILTMCFIIYTQKKVRDKANSGECKKNYADIIDQSMANFS